jgi:hypothetical protein
MTDARSGSVERTLDAAASRCREGSADVVRRSRPFDFAQGALRLAQGAVSLSNDAVSPSGLRSRSGCFGGVGSNRRP